MAPLKADETRPLGRSLGATLQHRRLYSGVTPPPRTTGSEVPLASAVSVHASSGGGALAQSHRISANVQWI